MPSLSLAEQIAQLDAPPVGMFLCIIHTLANVCVLDFDPEDAFVAGANSEGEEQEADDNSVAAAREHYVDVG